jgi:hypothetical protein
MAYKFQSELAILSGNISPAVDDTFDLGIGAAQWKDLHLDGIAYIDQLGTDADPTTAYIGGGEVDGTIVGGETPAAGSFTVLTSTSTLVMPTNTAGYLLVADGSDYEEVAVSGDATLASGGAITIADDAVTLAKMASLARGSVIIGDASGNPSALGKGATSTFLQSDGTDTAYVAMTGDATLSAGAITIADNAVTLAKMAGLARGSIILGDASADPSALANGAAHTFLQSDGTDTAYVAMSGDATLSAGAITIADNAVTLAKMAGLTRGSVIIGDASGDPSALVKGAANTFLQSDGTDTTYVAMSGDATLSAGAISIGATRVTDAMINNDVATGLAGVGLGASSGVMFVDLNELATSTAFAPSADYFGFVDVTDGTSNKSLWSVVATSIAGAGITATNGVLSSDASPTPTSHGDANATLVEGMNWSTAAFTAARTWTLPASPDAGDTVSVKAPTNAQVYELIVLKAGSQTIDGLSTVVLASPNAAVDFVYVGSDKWLIK